jgi:hypothetical protein
VQVKNGKGVRYTVPQQIRPDQMEKSVEIFFRSSEIFKDVTISVTSGGAQIAHFSREHMAPGEMEKITLPKPFFSKIGGELEVSVAKSASKDASSKEAVYEDADLHCMPQGLSSPDR